MCFVWAFIAKKSWVSPVKPITPPTSVTKEIRGRGGNGLQF